VIGSWLEKPANGRIPPWSRYKVILSLITLARKKRCRIVPKPSWWVGIAELRVRYASAERRVPIGFHFEIIGSDCRL
jgi:hypothetical protein